MAQNTASPDSHEIPLTVWGGLVTYIDPTSLPQGVSPDNAEMQFAPGGVSSRDAFKKYFANPLYPISTRTYQKTFVDPKGVVRNLYFYSNGALTVENVTANPGIETLLSQTSAPGAWAKSITAFGREYIAISDTLHGAEIPLQYDGTNLDRVTQDGPGSSPTVQNLPLPAVSMAASPGGASLTLSSVQLTDYFAPGGYYTTATFTVVSGALGLNPSGEITIAGSSNAAFNTISPILSIPNDTTIITPFYSTTFQSATGGTVAGTGSVSMTRQSNIVTVTTAADSNLQPGYQAQITGVAAAVVGTGISTATVNNEDAPGIATIVTSSAHGLVPGLKVSLTGIAGTSVGGGISSIVRNGQVVTVTTASAHGLAPGGIITIAGVTTTSFNTTATVLNVVSLTVFTYAQADVDASDSTGTVTLNWPIFATATPTYFEVIAAPTATSFQVQLNYSDGSWTGGSVTYAWDGSFSVMAVLPFVATSKTTLSGAVSSTTTTSISVTSGTGIANGSTIQIGSEQAFVVSGGGTGTLTVTRGANGTTAATHLNGAAVSLVTFSFTYQQYGPDATVAFASGQTVTPYGQAAPGKRQMTCFFITRQGYTTRYSPPVHIVTNGGQYLSVSNIPIGPSNVIARVLAFTGALGAYFYYIPAPPQINGLLVGTSTVINDNTTTSVTLDFSDPTLFAGLGISLAGNNLANQRILDGALGFGRYASRLITYGQRNTIQNLLNMGFDGGYLPLSPTLPTGWSGGGAGTIAAGHYGSGWTTSATPLTQSFYEEDSGAPIALGNTAYTFRAWISAAGTVTATISSASTSFTSTATLTATASGWYERPFSLKMPTSIPSDMTLGITGSGVVVDEMNIIYTDTPYLTTLLGSYVNNPEAFDGVSGVFGPTDDTHQTLALGIIRSNLYLLTQEPSGRLHQTSAGNTEPSQWVVDEVGQNCGTVSAFSLTTSQANDNTGGGGEEWFAWYSSAGPRIFGGEYPFKIAQEIMRRKGRVPPGAPPDLSNINTAAQGTVWGLNDPVAKIMYFGVPMNSASAPSTIWMLNYLGCDTSGEIASQDPVHRAVNTGKMIANDLGRKWSPWNRPMNSAALMLDSDGEIRAVFSGGTGATPGIFTGVVNTVNQPIGTETNVYWVSGDNFSGIQGGQAITIAGGSYSVLVVLSPTILIVTTQVGTLNGVQYSAPTANGFGNVYTLDPDLKTDDDYGVIAPHYVGSPLPDPELAQALGIGGGLKTCAYSYGLISGTGIMTISIAFNLLSKIWRINSATGGSPIVMSENPDNDTEFGCGQATGKRFWFKWASTPETGTDTDFEINNWTVAIKRNPRMPSRGSNR